MGRLTEAGRSLVRGFTDAWRKLANPDARADQNVWAQRVLLEKERVRLIKDTERLIPQFVDIIDGTLKDTDELLRTDNEAYEVIYDDDQIASSLDNAFLRVAQAKVVFDDRGRTDTAKLIPYLRDFAVDRPGWTNAVLELCHAEVTGIALIRMVWDIDSQPGETDKRRFPLFKIAEKSGFVPKDKRRFRPADPEWENMFLVDSGITPLGAAGVLHLDIRKPIDREHYIIHRWRNTEDRHGWGKGIGARLYRLAKYRKPLMHLLLQALENTGGGIRYVVTEAEKMQGASYDEQVAAISAVKDQLKHMISGDTAVFPAGMTPVLFFPPNQVGGAIREAIDLYFDKLVQKTVSGETSSQGDNTGADAGAKEVSKIAARRDQYRAQSIGETVDYDYFRLFLEYNPWIYKKEGIPINTPRPRATLVTDNGDDKVQKAAWLNQVRVAVRKADYAEAFGLEEASDEEVENGKAFIPAEAGAATGGGPGGGAMPRIPGSPGVFDSATPGAPSTPNLNAPGTPGGKSIPGVPKALPMRSNERIDHARRNYQEAIRMRDRTLADAARHDLLEAMGRATKPLSDDEWASVVGPSPHIFAAMREISRGPSGTKQGGQFIAKDTALEQTEQESPGFGQPAPPFIQELANAADMDPNHIAKVLGTKDPKPYKPSKSLLRKIGDALGLTSEAPGGDTEEGVDTTDTAPVDKADKLLDKAKKKFDQLRDKFSASLQEEGYSESAANTMGTAIAGQAVVGIFAPAPGAIALTGAALVEFGVAKFGRRLWNTVAEKINALIGGAEPEVARRFRRLQQDNFLDNLLSIHPDEAKAGGLLAFAAMASGFEPEQASQIAIIGAPEFTDELTNGQQVENPESSDEAGGLGEDAE